MAQFPAYCQNCKIVFPATLLSADNVTDLTIRNCSETCPRCGAMARIAEGTFNIQDDVISIVNAPNFTKQLIEFTKLLQKAHDSEKSPSEVASEVEKIDPRLKSVVLKAGSAPRAKNGWVYPLLLALFVALNPSCDVNVNLDVSIDVNDLFKEIMAILKSND